MNNHKRAEAEYVAGGGLLHRRALIGAMFLAPAGAASAQSAAIGPVPAWSSTPGAVFTPYGHPSPFAAPARLVPASPGRTGVSRTPLHLLEGTITPNSLHFERHHNGVPAVDPAQHRLIIHGMVRQPLVFTLDKLLRYPMETHNRYIECGGNSGGLSAATPRQDTAGGLHGLLSMAEWTGVRLSHLLDEAGVDAAARWVIAEGADADSLTRSVPIEKCLDDAVIALFQNGEPIRPEQGYPMRLLLPGFEGNTQIKWLRRLQVASEPANTRDETSRYTDLMKDGKARQFVLMGGAKSIILKPSYGLNMQGPGFYQISGLAWSGAGAITKVEVSADGGKSWGKAAIDGVAQPKGLTRFRMPWRWDGAPAQLVSRAYDDRGRVQPTRSEWQSNLQPSSNYHYNGYQVWGVDSGGAIRNVYL